MNTKKTLERIWVIQKVNKKINKGVIGVKFNNDGKSFASFSFDRKVNFYYKFKR
jgi:hypothetical protein